MSVTRRRMARKGHKCGCGRIILPGEAYLSGVVFPGEDGHHYATAGPVRMAECGHCATRYGRADMLEPLPDKQADALHLHSMREGWG